MIKKYRFIGENGSMGYINGSIYELNVQETTFSQRTLNSWPSNWKIIAHQVLSGDRSIPYESWIAFDANWEEVEA